MQKMKRLTPLWFVSMLLWWPFGVTAKEADAVDEKPAVDQRIATSVFEKAASGSLLSNQGPWIGPKVTGGPGIWTEDRTLFLADISFTAQVICNLGRDGLEECYRRLDGKSQSARIVAIYALQLAFGFEDTLVVQAPMVGLYDGKPRDLNPSEISELKKRYRPKLDELRDQTKN